MTWFLSTELQKIRSEEGLYSKRPPINSLPWPVYIINSCDKTKLSR